MKTLLSLALQLAVATQIVGVGPGQAPRFCWLAFGPEARVRILVRLDGDAISLTHHLDGKPTGRTDRYRDLDLCKGVEIADPDGKTVYILTSVFRSGGPGEFVANVDIKGPVNYQQYCEIPVMAGKLEKASLAHFHGPLVIEIIKVHGKLPSDLKLQRGQKPGALGANIGTFDDSKGCWVAVRIEDKGESLLPDNGCPVADVEFPPKKHGDPSIRKRYTLPTVC